MNKGIKWGYYISTGLFTAMIALSVITFYFGQTEMAQQAFVGLSFPAWLVLPLGVAKLLGLAVLWFKKFPLLTTIAYAGFMFNLILAVMAHLNVGDGEFGGALGALIILIGSWYTSSRLNDVSVAAEIA